MDQVRGLEEQDGDAAGWDVVAAEVGEEALELLEPAGAAVVGVEVDGAAVDAFRSNFGRRWSMKGCAQLEPYSEETAIPDVTSGLVID